MKTIRKTLYGLSLLFSKGGRQYLFEKHTGRTSKWRTVLCRMRFHPCGCVWFSSGMEPDYSCKNCGDEI